MERRGAGAAGRGRPHAIRCAVHAGSAPRDEAGMARTRARPAAARSQSALEQSSSRGLRELGRPGPLVERRPVPARGDLPAYRPSTHRPARRPALRETDAPPRLPPGLAPERSSEGWRRAKPPRGRARIAAPGSWARNDDRRSPAAVRHDRETPLRGRGYEVRLSEAVGVCQGFYSFKHCQPLPTYNA